MNIIHRLTAYFKQRRERAALKRDRKLWEIVRMEKAKLCGQGGGLNAESFGRHMLEYGIKNRKKFRL